MCFGPICIKRVWGKTFERKIEEREIPKEGEMELIHIEGVKEMHKQTTDFSKSLASVT